MWTLAAAIPGCEIVPRTVLRNGKRAKEEWIRCQEKTSVRERDSVLSDVGWCAEGSKCPGAVPAGSVGSVALQSDSHNVDAGAMPAVEGSGRDWSQVCG